jgi:hypothetical protein
MGTMHANLVAAFPKVRFNVAALVANSKNSLRPREHRGTIQRAQPRALQPFLRVRLFAFALVAVGGLLAAPISAASAPTPQVETFNDEGSFEIGPCPSGVTLVENYAENVVVITFFDQTGNPTRLQVHFDYEGVVTNPATGQSVKDPAHGTRFTNLTNGTRALVGLFYSTTVPGVGVEFHDVGRLVRDPDGSITFEAGPHDALHTGNDAALFCAALGA